MIHKSVLLNETIEILNPQQGEFFIDGTFGEGGHAKVILEKIGQAGKLLAIDWNAEAINNCDSELGKWGNIICVNGNFSDLPEILEKNNLPKANGLLLDLGISSDELENSGRGFSFNRNEPLLMTYSDHQTPVKQLIRELGIEELAGIIKTYSDERWAIKIAQAIKDYQKKKNIETTKELVEIITKVVPKYYERGRIHPATRTFMALRIYANKELENLENILKNLEKILLSKGRVAIISFHSLEDRLVKNYFRNLAKTGQLEITTKKPIIPTREEIFNNPRSRSAKLRSAILNLNNDHYHQTTTKFT